jgi:uncharacterized OsmC-like protein
MIGLPVAAGPAGGRAPNAAAPTIRNAVARSLGDGAVLVTMRRGPLGPWTTVVDEPQSDRAPLGPPPGFLALVGIGTCTIVTVAGVDSRGRAALRGIEVAFDVGVATDADDGLVTIRQATTLTGKVDERDRVRLGRAIAHCPVGKNFTKRGVEIVDEVEIREATVPRPARGQVEEAQSRPDSPRRVFAPGRVRAVQVPGTGEWTQLPGQDRPILVQEGEARVQVEWQSVDGRSHHAGYLGGHSSAGWAPRPSAYAIAALAASSLLTLRSMAASLAIDPDAIEVEIEVVSDRPAGGKEASQDAAAAGRTGSVGWRRSASVEGRAGPAAVQGIVDALRRDPIAGICRRGDLLAEERVHVVPPTQPRP